MKRLTLVLLPVLILALAYCINTVSREMETAASAPPGSSGRETPRSPWRRATSATA